MKKLTAIILSLLLGLFFTTNVSAQSVATQKKVVSTYEINNPEQLFPFPSSDCPDKDKGDANCNGNVNFFDLSIWQVESNNSEGSKRADFNGDGFVNLTDYGIWRGTFYGDSTPLSSLESNQGSSFFPWIPDQVRNDKLLGLLAGVYAGLRSDAGMTIEVHAQSPTTDIQNSQAFTSENNSSLIINQNPNGTSSEIRMDKNSNPFSSLILDTNGNVTAQANFTATGDEWVTTSQEGVIIQTLKKAEGPVFQFFKDSTDKTLAIKSWPTLSSLEKNDPPLAVTLPIRESKWLTLNINPNGTSIVAQTDNQGSVLSQTQYREDGTYLNLNNQYQILTESNEKIGLLTISMPNSLGGRTTYNFYQSGLYAIVQTDKAGNYYIAKPADSEGNSWSLTSSLDPAEKTIADPIAEVGSNTPSPKEIIADINYYKSLPQNNSGINFTDGFGNNSRLYQGQTAKANEILKIESSTTPEAQASNSWVFGIKEAFAKLDVDQVIENPKENDNNQGNSKTRTGSNDKDKSNSSGSSAAAAAAPASNTQAKVGIGANTANIAVAADGTQTNKISGANGQELASGTTNTNANTTFSSAGSDVAVNSGYVARFVPATPGGGTPVSTPQQPSGPTTCFLAGTKISTPNGPIPIETLKPGMKVYSFNESTGQKEVADFAGVDINFVDEYLIINDKIQTTTYHPFYVVSFPRMRESKKQRAPVFDWIPAFAGMTNKTSGLLSLVKAGKLKVGDLLVDESGNFVPITSIQKIAKKETVYNLLTVTPNNNFYAEGILVHNYQQDDYTEGHDNNATEQNGSNQSFDNEGNEI